MQHVPGPSAECGARNPFSPTDRRKEDAYTIHSKFMEKGRMFLLIALLGCLSLGALAEETLQTIQNMHRACAFASGEVAREDLELILKSGVSTAVQLERQPWKFVAITDAELLEQIGDESQQMLDALQAEADTSAEGEIGAFAIKVRNR